MSSLLKWKMTFILDSWNSSSVVHLASVFKEIHLSVDELQPVILKFIKAMHDVDVQEIPPLVYQLLILSSKVAVVVFGSSYSSRMSLLLITLLVLQLITINISAIVIIIVAKQLLLVVVVEMDRKGFCYSVMSINLKVIFI